MRLKKLYHILFLLLIFFFISKDYVFSEEEIPVSNSQEINESNIWENWWEELSNPTLLQQEENFWTGEQVNWEENIIQENSIPAIIYTLQSPSYLIQKSENIYECDASKSECKVNFDLRDTFSWYVSTKYECTIDFWLYTWEETKCNPNTIIFPKWEFYVKFIIQEKDNHHIFREKDLTIINKEIIKEVPNPILTIQSWLTQKEENYFECKTEECSANLTLEDSFLSWSISSYICTWDVWNWVFDSLDTPEKCNPSYIQFPFWKHSLKAKISEKWNETNFKELYFTIENNFSQKNIDEELSSSWTINFTPNIIPPLEITLQSPSYLIQKAEDTYECDMSKWDCKANFDLRETFGWYIPTKYECHIDFPFWTGEEAKCNPNTILFPEWVFELKFIIQEKENPFNFNEKIIKISNLKKETSSASSESLSQIDDEKKDEREIIIQWGLEKETNEKFICAEEMCGVNFTFKQKSKESCLWDFGGGNFKEKYKYTCNPWKVYFTNGVYKVSLQVFDEKTSLTRQYFFSFENKYFEKMRQTNTPPQAKISIQWKLAKNKKLESNKLVCYDTLECSINFTGKESIDLEKNSLDYFWDFWDGETFSWVNPNAKKYPPWKYKISLTVKDTFSQSSDYFFVEILASGQIEEKFLDKNIFTSLKISRVNANPKWVDNNEWIEIKNTSFSLLNLKWLIIEDSMLWWSKKYTITDDFYLFPLEKKKFYKSLTHINLNNDKDEVNLIYNMKVIDTMSWNFPLMDDYILTAENLNIESQKVKVIEVIDGDTILIEFFDGRQEKLRLIGVDTPETKHPKKKVEYFWKEASDFTKKTLSWKEVFLEIDKENYRDKYGRLLGYIYFEENEEKKSFNLRLIELGYARAYLVFPFKYSILFKEAQTLARKNLVWMWWDEEMVKEIKILEKEEKELIQEEQIQLIEENNLEVFATRFYDFMEQDDFNFWKKYFSNKVLSMYKRWQLGENTIKISNFSEKEKQNIQKTFRISIAKLKSWLRFSGTTLPFSTIRIYYDDFVYETFSDEKWKYSYKTLENIQVWNYEARFEVIEQNGNIHTIEKTKTFSLTKEYVNSIQAVLVKKYEKELKKLQKKKKVKKAKKKKPKKSKAPKEKKIAIRTEYKTNNFVASWQNIDMRLLNFLVLIFWVLVLYLVVDKKEEKE